MECISHEYSDVWTEQANLGFKYKPQIKSQGQLWRMKLLGSRGCSHSNQRCPVQPGVSSRGMNDLSRQCREARQEQVKTERLRASEGILGQKQLWIPSGFRSSQLLRAQAPHAGSPVALEQSSYKPSPELPPLLGTCGCEGTHSFTQTCAKDRSSREVTNRDTCKWTWPRNRPAEDPSLKSIIKYACKHIFQRQLLGQPPELYWCTLGQMKSQLWIIFIP